MHTIQPSLFINIVYYCACDSILPIKATIYTYTRDVCSLIVHLPNNKQYMFKNNQNHGKLFRSSKSLSNLTILFESSETFLTGNLIQWKTIFV